MKKLGFETVLKARTEQKKKRDMGSLDMKFF